jgi:nucleotide-binding universal stress UspA family protein
VSDAIVCAVDASDAARDALSIGAQLAEALGLDLVLLHAVEPEPAVAAAAGPYSYVPAAPAEPSVERGRQLLDAVAVEVLGQQSVDRRVELGDPSQVVPALAERVGAVLIAVGTRGRGRASTAILGSVSAATISRSSVPVMVVPANARLRPGRPIVCAVDDSPAARSATRVALWLSAHLGGELLVAHAIAHSPPPSASAAPGVSDRLAALERREARRFLARLALEEGLGAEVEHRLTQGNEAESISALADEEDASLVVVGTRRQGGLRSALVGSVSHDMRSISPRPVLVVPTGARTRIRT